MSALSPATAAAQPSAGVPTGLLAWEHERFERVTAELDLDPTTICALHCASQSLIVELPLQRDDGSMTVLTGYRVQHSNALRPAKGGTRFRAGVELDDVTALARLMTWKTALHGPPFGGAKGGVDCDPADLSARELHEVTRLYTLAILPNIGADVDVPAPDVGTNEQSMAWMLHAAAEAGRSDPAIVTGKPVILGGSLFRSASTGVGVAHVAERAWDHLGHQVADAVSSVSPTCWDCVVLDAASCASSRSGKPTTPRAPTRPPATGDEVSVQAATNRIARDLITSVCVPSWMIARPSLVAETIDWLVAAAS